MWQEFLRKNYRTRDEWLRYSDTYGLAERLGYGSAEEAWEDNPFIQGSTNPADFCKVDTSGFRDAEIIGIDADDSLICWDRSCGVPYNCGETLESYGEHNLTGPERKRLGLTP